MTHCQGASDALVGMTIEQAMFRHTELIVLDADESFYKAIFDDALNALHPRLLRGIGAPRFASRLAARLCEGGEFLHTSGDAASWLAPILVGLLPISEGLRSYLRRFDLRSMSAVAATGTDALADRFGREGTLAWKLCVGLDDGPFVICRCAEPLVESLSLPSHQQSQVRQVTYFVDATQVVRLN